MYQQSTYQLSIRLFIALSFAVSMGIVVFEILALRDFRLVGFQHLRLWRSLLDLSAL